MPTTDWFSSCEANKAQLIEAKKREKSLQDFAIRWKKSVDFLKRLPVSLPNITRYDGKHSLLRLQITRVMMADETRLFLSINTCFLSFSSAM